MSEEASTATFIERHGLRTGDQARQASELAKQAEFNGLHLVRLVWADPHGAARAKAVSVPTFKNALLRGYNINVATSTLDSANGRVFASFTAGGGMDLPEMTGSPNLVIVPDAKTFRVLPWAPGVGWVLCDEYFQDGRPFHFSPRHLLRRMIGALAGDGLRLVIGLEIEWYLARAVQEKLTYANIGWPGTRGRPIETAPVEPGFSYHSESNMDLMQPVLSELAQTYGKLGLKLRSMENEWGPGQVECTFAPGDALSAADDYLLMRTATRQLCRRLGYFASFMCKPALPGHYPSGWHLHQSLIDANGRNVLGGKGAAPLSVFGRSYLGGLLEHAVAGTVFATPTVNGYRRFQANSLAPDRAGWGIDHRGAMLRLVGRDGDPATRLENRVGEPAANPYLFIAAQIAAGRDGLARTLDAGAPDDEPYGAKRPLLPADLGQALAALDKSTMFRGAFGDLFVDYYLKLKGAELARFQAYVAGNKGIDEADEVTQWEQNEYYDFF
jgi:glutamine synthetase